MFRILVVDDNPSVGQLLRELAKELRRPVELSFVSDGEEALRFLHRQGAYADIRRPHMILLDMNMPRLGGLATLSAIKGDLELRVIPVIMFSTTASPEDLRKSYQAHANGFVQKPADLRRTVEFIRALEAFWIDVAQLADSDGGSPEGRISNARPSVPTLAPPDRIRDFSGPQIANAHGEDNSREMEEAAATRPTLERESRAGCEEHNRLLDRFGAVVQEILQLNQHQYRAIVEGDGETERFDLLIHMASEKKNAAKYDYLQHVAIHGCSKFDVPE
jgi:chemotaxis family two-component system response regulator Rcp1